MMWLSVGVEREIGVPIINDTFAGGIMARAEDSGLGLTAEWVCEMLQTETQAAMIARTREEGSVVET
jgi:hypothetical protein